MRLPGKKFETRPCVRRAARVATALVLAAAAAAAETPPLSRQECEAAHPAAWGRPGKDVVWIPTFDSAVLAMLSMARVTADDLVLDLGAGDGKIGIAAAKPPFGARAVGIEYDAEMAKLAACLVRAEGLEEKVRIVQGDIFKEDFGAPSVVTMYLLPELNLCVRHRLLAMEPGTRVVSHQFLMGDWTPDDSVQVLGRDVHLWVVPARVEGVWELRDSHDATFTIELRQVFGVLSGEIVRDGVREALATATLRGRELRFSFPEKGGLVQFSGTVRGEDLSGVLLAGNAARTAVGRLKGPRRGAPWAEMAPDCDRYYGRN